MEKIKLLKTEEKISNIELKCFHCGELCRTDHIRSNEKIFCCSGCRTVFEILEGNDLCTYYNLENNPGINRKNEFLRNYDFLEDKDIIRELIDYTDGPITTISFNIPQMHCSSCIWILESLYKFNKGILFSEVNFLQKRISLKFDGDKITLRQVVELLYSIGYEPHLDTEKTHEKKKIDLNKKLYYKIGIAGFCFGNIMLLSFPEYFSQGERDTENLKSFFSIINLLLSLPVLFYSATDYFSSAYRGLRNKIVNLDVPISLGITVLFSRSLYEVLYLGGSGYFDSLTGLVFFLLIGRLFQDKTYDLLNFERNYKSYFPIAVNVLEGKRETSIPIAKLKVGKRMLIRNGELIPSDAVLMSGEANIDYSFVSGESTPVQKRSGELIYAGGKQIGSLIELEVIKEVSQSYLTQLWNSKIFEDIFESPIESIVNAAGKYFTIVILLIATAAGLYWLPKSASLAVNAVSAVLIIACPCALALSLPFTLGNTLRIFGRNGFYLKNTSVIEKMAGINSIVFDKTGTLTESTHSSVNYEGTKLTKNEKSMVKSLVKNSSHPLSNKICQFLDSDIIYDTRNFKESIGAGLVAEINGFLVQLGSLDFINLEPGKVNSHKEHRFSRVYLKINNDFKGFFYIKNVYRKGINELASSLGRRYELTILSGDNDAEKERLEEIFQDSNVFFSQSPFDKLNYIIKLQKNQKKVLMFGDGLNDSGALKQSDVGISISDNINNFVPACDGILEAGKFNKLETFMSFSKTSIRIIIISFVISLLYNLIGLSFAVQGNLSPVIAAILMPLSSITVVFFTTLSTNFIALRRELL